MYSAELTDVLLQAQHLLWMLARYDVEGLSDQRRQVLRRLREAEARASELGVPDLYLQVLQNEVPKFIQSSYDEG
ncbi:MAG: hypothetical protein LAP40_19020 [Acidobacteriia bacterium]|nr:hypothetical protein [Terriglobia bacterium]